MYRYAAVKLVAYSNCSRSLYCAVTNIKLPNIPRISIKDEHTEKLLPVDLQPHAPMSPLFLTTLKSPW